MRSVCFFTFKYIDVMKLTAILFLCAIVAAASIGCSRKSELVPNDIQSITLSLGETQQIRINDLTYSVSYLSFKTEFSEGVHYGEIGKFYVRGKATLTINKDMVSLTAIGNYDSNGKRFPQDWSMLKDRNNTLAIESAEIGVANVYPDPKDTSTNPAYIVELLIQSL